MWTLPSLEMHPSLSTNYLLPAILLNPVLFLHSLNTILSRILPPIITTDPVQPPPYSNLGPSANHPHLDIHASENLCWSYTAVMVCAQLVAFGRVSRRREEGRERRERRKEEKRMALSQTEKGHDTAFNGLIRRQNGHGNGNGNQAHGKQAEELGETDSQEHTETEDEMML